MMTKAEESKDRNAIKVVPCKDCVYRVGNYCHKGKDGIVQYSTFVNPNDFCSYGERKDG